MDVQSLLHGKKLLAVDDEADVLEIIKEEFPGSTVITAQEFDGALKLINEDVFDLVILDIMGVNGFELPADPVKIGFMFTISGRGAAHGVIAK
jgi:CheY-like chemotaxis protein